MVYVLCLKVHVLYKKLNSTICHLDVVETNDDDGA